MTDRYASVHPHRPDESDLRPTATQVIDDCHQRQKLNDRIFFITGASSGLGFASAQALLLTGALVYITARDETTAEALSRKFNENDRVKVLVMNLLSYRSVQNCANEFLKQSTYLDVLLCNAGVMACPKTLSEDGVESQFAVNFLAHYQLFKALLPALKAAGCRGHNARVITVSSAGHKISTVNTNDINFDQIEYNEWTAYGRSKTAAIYLSNYIDRTHKASGIRANSLHPGSIFTPLQRHQPGMTANAAMYQTPEMQAMLKSEEQGAATSVWAAVEPALEDVGGKYLEDVQIATESTAEGPRAPGFASWAFDEDAEMRLIRTADKLLREEHVALFGSD